MNINATLNLARDRAARIQGIGDGNENGEWTPTETLRLAYLAGDLAEAFESLHRWIARGGSLPVAWQPSTRAATPEPCQCRCQAGRHCGGCGHAGCGYDRS